MKNLIRLEEAAMLILAVYLGTYLHYSWWWYWVWFLAPDLGMLGYLVNSNIGAITYNFIHHKGVGIIVYLVGLYMQSEPLQFCGLLLFGHSSFDRMFGYGLKYEDNFQHTHLGMIGKPAHGK